jgi:cytochrome P450
VTTDLEGELGRLFGSDPAVMADPFPLYRRLREHGAVFPFGPVTLLTEYDAVKEGLTNTDRFSNQIQRHGTSRVEAARQALPDDEHRRLFDDCLAIEHLWLVLSDGEDHITRRNIMRQAFTPKRIAVLEESVSAYVDKLLDDLAGSTVSDFNAFGARLPMLLICDLLEVPHEDAPQLEEWGDAILANLAGGQGTDKLRAAHHAYEEGIAYVEGRIEAMRRTDGRTEVLDALLKAEAATDSGDGARQLTAMFIEIQLGAFETTRAMLVLGLRELLNHPDQWERLLGDPSLARPATEELLRLLSPGQWQARVARHDIEYLGVEIPANQTVMLMFGCANRDPRMFADPERLDVTRSNARNHVSFGVGPHYCLGQALARMEGRLTFERIARRFPEVELVENEDVWVGHSQTRHLAELPIRLGNEREGRNPS